MKFNNGRIIFIIIVLSISSITLQSNLVPLSSPNIESKTTKAIFLNDEFTYNNSNNANSKQNSNTSLYIETLAKKTKLPIRLLKLRLKKNLIVKKLYEYNPLLSEILALTQIEKIGLILNLDFLLLEEEVFEKHLIMQNLNTKLIKNAAKMILNMLLCNYKTNELRNNLLALMNGLCKGDNDSILIFREIVNAYIINYILNKPFYYLNDVITKTAILHMFNSFEMRYEPIVKIQFVNDHLNISKEFKEKLTFIILDLYPKEKVTTKIIDASHVIPNFPGKIEDIDRDKVDKSIIEKDTLSEEETRKKDVKETKASAKSKFVDKDDPHVIISFIEKDFVLRDNKQTILFTDPIKNIVFGIKTTEITDSKQFKKMIIEIIENMKNEYSENAVKSTTFKMPFVENKVNMEGYKERSVFSRIKRHVYQLIELNFILDAFDENVIVKGGVRIITKKSKLIDRIVKKKDGLDSINESINKNELNRLSSTNQNKMENIKFNFKEKEIDETFSEKELFEESNASNQQAEFKANTMQNDNKSVIKGDNEINKVVNDIVKNDKDIKVIYPQEIRSKRIVKIPKKKTVLKKPDSSLFEDLKTQLDDNSIHDLLKQNTDVECKPEVEETLVNIIKNIELRKCSEGFICIETGIIIGDFMDFKSKNFTYNSTEEKDVEVIIKPILIVNNTKPTPPGTVNNQPPIIEEDCDDVLSGNFGIIDAAVNRAKVETHRFKELASSTTVTELKKSQSENISKIKNTQVSITEVKFSAFKSVKEVVDDFNEENSNEKIDLNSKITIGIRHYRKVSIGTREIYTKHTFKQGLNLLIINRDKKYTKLHEETFNTNDSHKESDKLADILKNTQANRIIVLTGIGRWIGALTPSLIKEIKQFGGPDLNELIEFHVSQANDLQSIEYNDFILIGRRGLCKYNGVWKVDNFDYFKKDDTCEENDPLRYLATIKNPNECYFEDLKPEQILVINQMKKYFGAQKVRILESIAMHETIDITNINSSTYSATRIIKTKYFTIPLMRMSLNLNKDSRFYYLAPTVTGITPNMGSIHGGQEVKITGFNFGLHTVDVKHVLIKGIVCGDFIVISPKLISCVTRASTIFGPGAASVSIIMKSGLTTPQKTCFYYNYIGDKVGALNDLKRSIDNIKAMEGNHLPIYLNTKHVDNKIKIFDHLVLDNNIVHSRTALKDRELNDESLKNDDSSNLGKVHQFEIKKLDKINLLAKKNFENLVEKVGLNDPTNVFIPDSFRNHRKSRFLHVVENLKNK